MFYNEISYEEAVQTGEEFAKLYNKSITIAQDANRDWKIYPEIAYVIYETEEMFEKGALVMGLEERNDNQSIYRSLTTPEITLIVKQNKETNKTEYKLVKGN